MIVFAALAVILLALAGAAGVCDRARWPDPDYRSAERFDRELEAMRRVSSRRLVGDRIDTGPVVTARAGVPDGESYSVLWDDAAPLRKALAALAEAMPAAYDRAIARFESEHPRG